MSYENPDRRMYSFGIFDFGGGADETFSVKGPKGKAGTLVDYGVYGTTEVFEGTTTTPKIAVGTTADPDAYGDELDLDSLAADDAKSVAILYNPVSDSEFASLMVDRSIPKDTEVVVTCTAGVGAQTGMGVPFVVIDWEW